MKITDDKLRGRVVLSGDGIAIGDVSRLLIDGAQFTIAAVEIKLRKEIAERMGIERSLWHGAVVEIPASAVRSVGDAVLLGVTVDEVRMMSVASGAGRDHDKRGGVRDKLDRDNDGKLDRDDLRAKPAGARDELRAKPAGTTPPPPGGVRDRMDRNDDGRVDRKDLQGVANVPQSGLVDERGERVGRPVDPREGEGHSVDVRELREEARPRPQR